MTPSVIMVGMCKPIIIICVTSLSPFEPGNVYGRPLFEQSTYIDRLLLSGITWVLDVVSFERGCHGHIFSYLWHIVYHPLTSKDFSASHVRFMYCQTQGTTYQFHQRRRSSTNALSSAFLVSLNHLTMVLQNLLWLKIPSTTLQLPQLESTNQIYVSILVQNA